jgi:hypothetical protein
MQLLCADFGCQDQWFEADGYFAAGNPPWLSTEHTLAASEQAQPGAEMGPVALAAKARAEQAFMGINRTVPTAIWLYQGWILPGAAPFTEGLVSAVPPGRLVISDMRCEDPGGCEWTDDYAHGGSFYGAPFIWGTLHDFGGNLGMWGSFPTLATVPLAAFCSNVSTAVGVGMLPEGIGRSAILLLEHIQIDPLPLIDPHCSQLTLIACLTARSKQPVVHSAARYQLGVG